MISVLIPTYNHSVVTLVSDIEKQCIDTKINFEIIVIDDNSNESTKTENRKIQSYKNVIYKELTQNIGRSKIRNMLGEMATFPTLLFLDCDAGIVSDTFIKNYINKNNDLVVCGGTMYDSKPPTTDKQLRWLYGRKYEMRSAKKRSINPNKSFSAFNFLISKATFLSIKFDESISQYGHEDSVFGFHLWEKGIPITHIDNPLQHLGLDNNQDFIKKTEDSISNLIQLEKKLPQQFKNEIRLLGLYKKLKKIHGDQICYRIYKKYGNKLKSALQTKPNILKFNLFKISYFCYLKHQEK
ncbi:MAG: glycosyltransferase [Bacteroidales bacterium]|nr:glycosyltransferase [Bacteroidales bacterium]